jgi:hypothetical protein
MRPRTGSCECTRLKGGKGVSEEKEEVSGTLFGYPAVNSWKRLLRGCESFRSADRRTQHVGCSASTIAQPVVVLTEHPTGATILIWCVLHGAEDAPNSASSGTSFFTSRLVNVTCRCGGGPALWLRHGVLVARTAKRGCRAGVGGAYLARSRFGYSATAVARRLGYRGPSGVSQAVALGFH